MSKDSINSRRHNTNNNNNNNNNNVSSSSHKRNINNKPLDRPTLASTVSIVLSSLPS